MANTNSNNIINIIVKLIENIYSYYILSKI